VSTAHTIQDEWLLSYAAGALTPGQSLLVASHAAYRDDVKQKLADADAIGGAMLESIGTSDVDRRVLERLLGQLDTAPPEIVTPRAAEIFPEPLVEFCGGGVDSLKWRFMGPGMSHVRLWNGPNDERLWLLRAGGGVEVPEHGHNGDEWTLILKGAFQTSAGHYRVGDMDIADESVEHQPIIDPDEECICLALTHGPIRFKSFAARLAQPLIGL